MKTILTFLLLGLSFLCYAQKELQIEYDTKSGICSKRWDIVSILRANNKNALYHESETHMDFGSSGEQETRIRNLNYNFKDLLTNTIWSKEEDGHLIKEKMDLFQWSFTNELDTLLSYNCKKAKANFRGREYIAWFTTDLPFKAAPWKICGLPGVVLKVETTDQFYVLEAKNIAIVNSKKELCMPFNDKKSITWNNYKIAYKKQIQENENQMRALEVKYGRKYDNPYPKIEIIVNKNKQNINDFLKEIGLIK